MLDQQSISTVASYRIGRRRRSTARVVTPQGHRGRHALHTSSAEGHRGRLAILALPGYLRLVTSDTGGAIWSVTRRETLDRFARLTAVRSQPLRVSPGQQLAGGRIQQRQRHWCRDRLQNIGLTESYTKRRCQRAFARSDSTCTIEICSSPQKMGACEAWTFASRSRMAWADLAISARNVVYSNDGEMIAFVCCGRRSVVLHRSAKPMVWPLDHLSWTPSRAISLTMTLIL